MNLNEIEILSYEQAFSRLEEIASLMGSATVPLEELMALYEEGMAIASHCEGLLKGYEARLEKVSKQAIERELDSADAPVPDEDDEEAPF